MESMFSDLLDFLGIVGEPSTMGELIPWVFSVIVAIGFVVAVFNFFRAITIILCRGKIF